MYMCLRRDMLLLDPSFVFTVILGRGSVTRLLSPPLALSVGLSDSPAPAEGAGSMLSFWGLHRLIITDSKSLGPQSQPLGPTHRGRSGAEAAPLRVPTRARGAHTTQSRTL